MTKNSNYLMTRKKTRAAVIMVVVVPTVAMVSVVKVEVLLWQLSLWSLLLLLWLVSVLLFVGHVFGCCLCLAFGVAAIVAVADDFCAAFAMTSRSSFSSLSASPPTPSP